MLIRLAPAAEQDIKNILSWTEQEFGSQMRMRYQELLAQTLIDLGANPERVGSVTRPEISQAARSYHLSFSRMRVSSTIGRVRRPRHFVVFRIVEDVLEVARILHDSMDLTQNLPALD